MRLPMQFIRLLTTFMTVMLGVHLLSSCSGKRSSKSSGSGAANSGASEIEVSGSISDEGPLDFVQSSESVSISGVNLTSTTSYLVTAYSVEPRGFKKLIFTGSFAEPKFSFKSSVARQYIVIEITRLPDGGQFGAVLPPPAGNKKASLVVDGTTTIAAKMASLIASKAASGDQGAQQALSSGNVSVADLLMVSQSVRTTVLEQKAQGKGSAIELSTLTANLISKSNERISKLNAEGQSSKTVAEKLSDSSYQTIFGDDAKAAPAGVLAYRVNPDLGSSEAAKATVAYEAIKASVSDSTKAVDEAFRAEATAYRTATSTAAAVAAKTTVASDFKAVFSSCVSSPSSCAQTIYTPPLPQSSAVEPVKAPGAPTAVTGAAGNTEVALSWTAPANNGGSAITDYVIEYSSNSGSTWVTFSDNTSTSTSATVTGLTNGTSYVFKVAAKNSAGTGNYSASSPSLTPVTTPGAPQSVTGTAGDMQVSLTWTAPANNGGNAITNYSIQYSSNSGSTWSEAINTGSTSTSHTVTGLTNGTAYVFKLAAVNAVGTGSYSTASASVTPRAPRTLYFTGATGDGDWSNLANWFDDQEGTVQASSLPTAADSVFASASITSNSSSAPTVVNFTLNDPSTNNYSLGISITVTVNATFNGNSGNYSNVSGNSTFNDSSFNEGTVSGDAMFNHSSNNNATVSGDATFNDSSNNYSTVTGNATFSDTSGNYSNVSGNSTFNDSSFNDGTVSGDATFNDSSNNNATVSGDAMFNHSSNNNATVSGDATFNDSSGNYSNVSGNATFNGSSINNATVGGIATFTGNACNWDDGTAGAFEPETPHCQLELGVPSSLLVKAGNTEISLTWVAPETTAPRGIFTRPLTDDYVIADYVIEYSSDSGSNWTTFGDGTSTSTSATVTGLTNGTAYIFRVAATNQFGTGSYRNSVSETPTSSPIACAGDCYTDAQGRAIGSERQGPDGTILTLVMGASGFKIWKEKDGTRILNATGLIANGWQKELTRAGTGFSETNFTVSSNIAGRVCPPNVFLSHSNMTAENRCLYYDAGNVEQTLEEKRGFGGEVFSIVVQADDKILVGGNFGSYQGNTRNRIARLNSGGSLDNEFNIGAGFDKNVHTLAVQGDGKILVGGSFKAYQGITRNNIARLNSDGSLDASFDIGTGFNFPGYLSGVRSIVVQEDGKILVGGSFTIYQGTTRKYIVRLNSDGSYDTSFNIGTGLNGTVFSLAVQGDGKILVGGSFTSYQGTARNYIARLNSDGSLDTSFAIGTGFNSSVLSIAVQGDGKILVGGYFTSYQGTTRNRIARLNSDGSLDTSFNIGTGFNNDVYTLAVQVDGKILVGGQFISYQGTTRDRILRLNSNGDEDAVEASDSLSAWNRAATGRGTASSYYEGNINTCGAKGMRLPTMYETTMHKPSSWLPTGDTGVNPTWAGSTNGVPSNASLWTASASTNNTDYYWLWSGTSGGRSSYNNALYVRCVLP